MLLVCDGCSCTPQTKSKFYKDAREMIVGLCNKVSGSVSFAVECFTIFHFEQSPVIRQCAAAAERPFCKRREIFRIPLAERSSVERISA